MIEICAAHLLMCGTAGSAGVVLGAVMLCGRYPTSLRYPFSTLASWGFLAFAGAGSALLAATMRQAGTQIVQQGSLDCILTGLVGAGAFLGIIKRTPVSRSAERRRRGQWASVFDYILAFLEKRIAMKVRQHVESRIGQMIGDVEAIVLLEFAVRLVDGFASANRKQKMAMKVQLDRCKCRGDYAEIIRLVLRMEYEIEWVTVELQKELERNRHRVSGQRQDVGGLDTGK